MSASHSEKKVADSVPEAKSEGVSCARATWKAWVFSLIAISLVSVIAASGSISYDPDSYAITPMLPDGDFRTECDGNHVCQGLRAALSFYSFTVCFFALGALYLFAFKPTMRKIIHVGVLLFFFAHTCAFARIAHTNLLYWERVMIPFIVTFAITLIHGLVLAIDGDLNG